MIRLLLLVFAVGLCTAEYTHYRLPTTVRPQKYNLRILTDIDNLRFEGDVKIALQIIEDTKRIILHAKNLTIDESKIVLKQLNSNELNCISSTNVNAEHDYYILNVCSELKAGTLYELSLPFAAELNRQLEGYYRSSYKDTEANQTRWLATTQFEPASARLAFPCFDEPDFKATFVVTLGYNKRYTGLSNTPVKQIREHESLKDFVWCEFEESVPMSTYLVAYIVHDFSHKVSEAKLMNHVQFRTWARPNAIDQCDYASEIGPAVLQYYENLFGIKFPLPKIDQIAIPDFSAGAMENWGLVTYRETALLYSANHSSFADKQRVASVIAHELAHQWFGNLVTMEWWTDLWLNEGFATYVASLGVENISPEWDSLQQVSLSNLLNVFRLDSLESSHPVSRPIQKVSDIRESFDSISYDKGSTVLRMMHLFLGDESFRMGLNEYLKQYSYKNAKQDYLWDSLTQAAHKLRVLPKNYDIKAIMDSWTLQTGYPIINVTRNYEAGTAKISQQRYLLNSQASRTKQTNCWWVPLSYTTQHESDFNATSPKSWLECTMSGDSIPKTIESLPDRNEWVMFNLQLSTLYKINYDERNWDLLITELTEGNFERIHVLNRAQLLDDALTLAWSGDQNYDIAMRLLEYLEREREYLPWKAATENLNKVSRIIRQTPEFEFFKKYMQKILTPIYNHVNGLNDTFNDLKRQDSILLKTLIASWACRFNVEDCVPKARNYFQNWRNEPEPDKVNPVPINLRSTVYCTAIRHGDDEDWKFLWARYKQSNVGAEKKTIINALGCSREIWLLQRYLESTFDGSDVIRKQDSSFAFQSVALNEIGYHLAKDYFMTNIDFLHRFYHPANNQLGRLLGPLAKQIITYNDLEKFKIFFEDNKRSLEGIDQAIQQALEAGLINTQWKEIKFPEMSRSIRNLI